MRDSIFSNSESNLMIEKSTMDTSMTTIRKLVPQRGCWRGWRRALATVSSSPDSQAKTVLCSAPWYSKTRLMSFSREKLKIMTTKKNIRITPSTRLNATDGRTGFIYACSHTHASLYQAAPDAAAPANGSDEIWGALPQPK